jgi:hypothetical protein
MAAQGFFAAHGFVAGMAAQGLIAAGLAAHGFIACGLAAQGLPCCVTVFGAQGLHGLAAYRGALPMARPSRPAVQALVSSVFAVGFFMA